MTLSFSSAITLYDALPETELFGDVTLTAGKAPAPFDPATPVVPDANGGLFIYVDPDTYKWAQAAGRQCAGAGLFKVSLCALGLKIGVREVVDFVMGLYDGRHDIHLFAPLSPEDMAVARVECAILHSARFFADCDARTVTPRLLCEFALELVQKAVVLRNDGAKVSGRVLSAPDEDFAFTGLLNVGAGNAPERPACMGIIDFIPAGRENDPHFDAVLVGKGITFDSGGLDLKPPRFMATMRTDKCGAVYLAHALALAVSSGLNKKVRFYVPATDNVVSGNAMHPGDILSYKNGVSVEVTNTDAEGRLILADALIEASALDTSLIVEASTLTGAAKTSLGRDITAYFTSDDALASEVEAAFKAGGEDLWRLPLRDYHLFFIKGKRSTLVNSSSADGAPGASTAALFLSQFTGDKRFVHFDLSSAFSPEGGQFYAAQTATAATVRSVAGLLMEA